MPFFVQLQHKTPQKMKLKFKKKSLYATSQQIHFLNKKFIYFQNVIS